MEFGWIPEFIGGLLHEPFNKPYFLLPFFVLEELGIPFPLIFSGIFIYAGYCLVQGEFTVLWLIPVNIIGGMIGSSAVYWLSRRGLLGSLRWFNRFVHLDNTFMIIMRSRLQQFGSVAVLFGRFLPMPMPVISFVSGLFCIPFGGFLFFVALSDLIWNVLYISTGVLAGYGLSYFLPNLGRPAYLVVTPALILRNL